jgi:membrane-associated protease RseP (regulator of RpoE activity)
MALRFDQGEAFFRFWVDSAFIASVWSQPALLVRGLPFACTLLAILLAHEFGHWGACRYYRIGVTQPYLLPEPVLLGTFGAFVRIRSVIYSRRELFDVALAGPLAGLVVALPAAVAGMAWSKVVPGINTQGDLVLGAPLVMSYLGEVYFPGVPSQDLYWHPVARAAWVGLLATALNLLPIGQLDGGHLLYACCGARQRRISEAAIVLLAILGFFYWPWWIWAAGLWRFRQHIYIHEERPLDAKRYALLLVALGIFAGGFVVAPIGAP